MNLLNSASSHKVSDGGEAKQLISVAVNESVRLKVPLPNKREGRFQLVTNESISKQI